MTEPHFQALTALSADIRARKVSPVEVAKAMLDRIERLDGDLASYTTVTPDLALAQARAAEAEIMAGRWRGPLHGVPLAVKDLCFTKGVPTTAGMSIHRDFVPDFDGTVVKRLAEAGSVLLGKLHMTEGACLEHHPEFPRPTNPWGAEIWTGVSSSGSGVSVAAGLAHCSIGSDTGGSIRFPTACCGLTGVKPTWGLVSRHGIFDLAESYDHLGPMARSAADCAAMLGAIAGADPDDPTTLTAPVPDYMAALAEGVWGARGVRIGIDRDFVGEGADPETIGLIEAALAALAEIGAAVRPVGFPDPGALYGLALEAIMAELAHAHRETYPAMKDRYGPWTGGGCETGLAAKPVTLAAATIERGKFRGRVARLFETVDLIVLPVYRDGTPSWDEVKAQTATDMDGFMRFTVPLNATGSPSVTLPCGFSASGRPVGFQLVGPHLSEALLLKVAHAYQQATDWHLRRPPIA
jgi:amidase